MDDSIGDIHGGDVLIEDDRIVEVGRNIDAGDAEVIDASSMIVAPGLINCHEHTWQTGVRGTVSNWTMFEYSQLMHATSVPHFTPDDVRIANLCGALNQLNCGTTTLFDWHHCNATTDHTDAAIDSLEEAGIRRSMATARPRPTRSRASRRSTSAPIRASGWSVCARAGCPRMTA